MKSIIPYLWQIIKTFLKINKKTSSPNYNSNVQMLPPSHSVIQKALYNVIQARVMSRKRHSKMSKEAEAPGKTKAINPSCGRQDQNENGIFPKSDWEDAALHLLSAPGYFVIQKALYFVILRQLAQVLHCQQRDYITICTTNLGLSN